jgi:hypothetical protein
LFVLGEEVFRFMGQLKLEKSEGQCWFEGLFEDYSSKALSSKI